jgi:hypothetical protein
VIAAINTGSVKTFAELALYNPMIITYIYRIFRNCLISVLRLPNLATFLAYLLKHGANPNNGLGTGLCLLSRVVGIGDIELVWLLLRHSTKIKDSGAL